MKNLVLVQVVDSYGPNKFLPLAISYQWLCAQLDPTVAQQWQVADVLIEKVNIRRWLDCLDYEPDAMAMSCYVWNWQYNQQLAREVKQRWPRCRVIIGGPQVDKHDPDLARRHGWFDLAVLGENETVFRQALMCEDPAVLAHIPGVITSATQQVVQPPRTDNLDSLPSPILTGFYDGIMQKYQQQHGQDLQWQVTFETMRGCPYHCAFCDIGDDYWNKTKLFDMQRIRQEIDWMSQRSIEYVSVCDSNWGLFERDYKITQWVIDAKLRTGYPRFWDVTWAKNNPERVQRIVMLDKVANSRLFKGVTFAMQSLDPETLGVISRFNIRDGATQRAMDYYRDQDVPTYSELIWPLPGETLQSYVQGLQRLIDLGQRDFLMVHPLVLTYNAPMGQPEYRAQHHLESQTLPLDTFWLDIEDPDSYILEMVDVVRSTDRITFEDMLQGHLVAHWLVVLYFYGWAHHVMAWLRKQRQVSELDFVQSWIEYFVCREDLVGLEHQATVTGLRDVFDKESVWGRRVSDTDTIYWEFKSATSVVIHRNRAEFAQCLSNFVRQRWQLDLPDLIKLNMDMCVDWRHSYPLTQQYDPQLLKDLFAIDSDRVVLDHWDRECRDDAFFIKKAYHWQRKNRYWRCSISAAG
jgi:putative methyltransferase